MKNLLLTGIFVVGSFLLGVFATAETFDSNGEDVLEYWLKAGQKFLGI